MATTATDTARIDHRIILERRLRELPDHKRQRVERETLQAIAYVWGWEDAHGANSFELPMGFSNARMEAVLDFVTEQRCSLPCIADHFTEYLSTL